jgi:hypothetical protein
MVARVLDMKEALKQMMADVEWDTYARTLSDTQRKPVRTQAREVRTLILSDDSEFWQSCINYYIVMKAKVAALKEFDGKQPCMGNIYIIIRALRHHVAALHNAPFNMLGHLVDALEVALRKREALVYSDLYYVGVLLNPHLIHNMDLCDDQHAMAELMKVFQDFSDTNEEFQAVKVEFNLYFYTLSLYCRDHVWSPTGLKEVAHVWWFISGKIGKLLRHIARRILAQVVSYSSCERNFSSYTFVHIKVRNRPHSSRIEDLVYVYTNSRVLNQNVTFPDEVANEWYKQSVVSEDSDSNGPTDLFYEYDGISTGHTPDANMDGVFTNDENKEAGAVQEFEIGKDGRELQGWAACHANGLHSRAPIDDDKNLSIITFASGIGLLNTDNILHGGQQVEKEPYVLDEDHEDMGTSPAASGEGSSI